MLLCVALSFLIPNAASLISPKTSAGFEGKNVQKYEYPTEVEAGSTVSASELFLPSCRSEISSGSFPFSSLAAEGSCWHPGDGNAPLCTCAFAGLGNAGQARLGKESCSSMVQLACLGRASQGIN